MRYSLIMPPHFHLVDTVMKQPRRNSLSRRRLTLASVDRSQFRPLEFSSPPMSSAASDQYGSGGPSSVASSTASPSSWGLPQHLMRQGGPDDRAKVQRHSLRKKSLALAYAVSFDLAVPDDESRKIIS